MGMPEVLQNNKYAESLHYLKKELSYETDEHENLLQVNTIVFDRVHQACPKYPERLQCLCDILRKKLGMKLGT